MAELYTKDQIRRRMYKHASTLWGVRNTEGIDSTVKLLIESLASEMFKLSGEVEAVEQRLLKKVASALTPDISLMAKPAYTIATAKPLYDKANIFPSDLFTCRLGASGGNNRLKTYKFTPITNFQLVDATIRYYVSSREFCEVGSDSEREAIAHLSIRDNSMNNQLWLGLKLGNSLSTLGKLTFYVDFPHLSDKYSYLQLLSLCQATIDDHRVGMKCGIQRFDYGSFSKQYSIEQMIDEDILNKYDPHFITADFSHVKSKELQRRKVPKEIEHLLSDEFIKGVDDDIVWLCLEFPVPFLAEILSDMKIALNAFVIINKYTTSITQKIDATSTIIPLMKSDLEYFIATTSVYDSKKEHLMEVPSAYHSSTGMYSVRRGGSERFNTANASTYLSRLTDLLYDESTAFISHNKEALQELVEQIQNQIRVLELKNREYEVNNEETSYVVIDKVASDESIVTVDYLLTNGVFANGLSIEEPLESNNMDIAESSTILLFAPKGGKSSPDERQRADIYRYLLLSRGSIYTREDIKNFCLAKYGEYVSSVDVSLGYRQSIKECEGFIRSLEVGLLFKERLRREHYNELVADIYQDLIRHSPQTYNYHITINE